MPFEVDFIAVGDGERSGDAIALRYGDLSHRAGHVVVVIDGGNTASGEKLVSRLVNDYRTDQVDIAISTHPDADHAVGLQVVLDQLQVTTLLMHRPWEYAQEIRHMFAGTLLTTPRFKDRLREALQAAHDAEQIAKRRKVTIVEPFAGTSTRDGILHVLGPSEAYYKSIVCEFDRTPEARNSAQRSTLLTGLLADVVSAQPKWSVESLEIETLKEPVVDPCRAANNSSVITHFMIEGNALLFTGDAGVTGLGQAIAFANNHGIQLAPLTLMQVPHHGSRRNVSPSILDQLVPRTAYISAAAKGAPKHPSKKVVNAIVRRQRRLYGADRVFVTQGIDLCHQHNMMPRPGWSPVPSLSFSEWVEESEA